MERGRLLVYPFFVEKKKIKKYFEKDLTFSFFLLTFNTWLRDKHPPSFTLYMKNSIFGYSLFNRRDNMDRETLKEIGSIIFDLEVDYGLSNKFELINMLYGLYDGYLYDELILEASDIDDKNLFRRICKIWVVVNKYPTL